MRRHRSICLGVSLASIMLVGGLAACGDDDEEVVPVAGETSSDTVGWQLAVFAADGAYSAYLPDSSGRPVLVRRDDGTHLTAAGGDRLASAVLTAVGQDWDLG